MSEEVNRVDHGEGKNGEHLSRRDEWGHALDVMGEARPPAAEGLPPVSWSDLTALNSTRLILDSVGPELLADIVSDFQDLLGTSCAVHEKNGDYALSFCGSGWCRFMAQSSRKLCAAADDRQALASGQWHCHESSWNEAACRAMASGLPTDGECRGGIRLFAVPIRAGEEIVGSVSVGYGDPPRGPEKLRGLAGTFKVGIDELRAAAETYVSRPAFVIAWAKKRVRFSARLIGEIVARKRMEEALRKSEEKFQDLFDNMQDALFIQAQDGHLVKVNREACERLGYSREELLELSPADLETPEQAGTFEERAETLRRQGQLLFETVRRRRNGTVFPVEVSARAFEADGQQLILSVCRDITERKRAVEALRRSEESYRQLFEQSVDGIIVTVEGKIVEANRAFCAIHGASLNEITGMESVSLIHPEERETAAQRVESLLSGERMVESFIYRSSWPDDSRKWVELRSKLIQWGGQTAIQTIVRDITEQKRAEEALRESEERFRQMIEFSPLPVAVLSPTRTVEYLNAKFMETFGYTLEEVPRATDWYYLAYPEASYRHRMKEEWVRAVASAVARNSTIQSIEAEVVCKDGSTRIMEILSTTVGSKLLALFNDLTERKQAERALQETNEALRTLIHAAPVAIIAFDRDGKVKLWNPAAEQMLGWREAEVLGQDLPHVGDDTVVEHKALRERVLQGETLTSIEIRRRKKEGSPIDMSFSAAPLHDAEGRVTGVMSVYVDISERKRAREERARLEAQMREVQKYESLGVLAGGIAHDFNNLLMAVLGNADLALARLPAASNARRNVAEIMRASQRAAELCRQMLAYSGRGRYVVERCDLSQIVRGMAQILEVSISKKATLHYDLAKPLPAVEADAAQMRQVIMNLVTNASEALGDGSGSITVTSRVVECDRPCLLESHLDDSLPEGRYVTLEVSDTGCGMDADTLSRIFDPFYTTKFQGRGLGLAAVLGIVRGHRGAIQVNSEPGKGTTVRVLLPALESLPDATAQGGMRSEPAPAQGSILLIDDDPNVRNVGSEMLTLLGFRVLTAEDGDEGLGVFRAHQQEIDCIILDLTMPRMGGEETLQELQRLRSDVRVILSSGYHEQEIRQRFVNQGLAGFIQKPYTVTRLLETLDRVLR